MAGVRGKRRYDSVDMTSPDPVNFIRQTCLGLPNVEERLSHGAPTFFHVKGKSFAMYVGVHHGERLAVWIAGAPGTQEALVQAAPNSFFRPPYVGVRGWIGVFLDGDVDWEELVELIGDAYKTTQSQTKRRNQLG